MTQTKPLRFTLHFSTDVEDDLGIRFTGPMDKILPEDLYDLEVEYEDDDGELVSLPLFASVRMHREGE